MGGEDKRHRRAAEAYRRSMGASEDSGFQKLTNEPRIRRKPPVEETPAHRPTPVPAAPRGHPERPVHAPRDHVHDSGPQRVAKLLITLGPERAANVIGRLSADEVERVAQAIIRTPNVRPSEAAALLEAIGEAGDSRPGAGGPEVAREILVRAFGEDRGERFFHDAVPDAPGHFAFLDDLEPHQLRLLFRDESAGAISVVIPHLDRPRASELLRELAPETQAEVVRRVARLGRLNRDVIVRIEDALKEKIRRQGHQVTQSVDGNDTLAAILRHMAPSEGGEILGALEVVDPELSRSVKERLYTTDLLLLLNDRDLSDLLREFGDEELALFMKGKPDEIRARVLKCVSERRRTAIAEEYAHLGARKRSEVDEITHELLERLRELGEDGTILVPREGDRYI